MFLDRSIMSNQNLGLAKDDHDFFSQELTINDNKSNIPKNTLTGNLFSGIYLFNCIKKNKKIEYIYCTLSKITVIFSANFLRSLHLHD